MELEEPAPRSRSDGGYDDDDGVGEAAEGSCADWEEDERQVKN